MEKELCELVSTKSLRIAIDVLEDTDIEMKCFSIFFLWDEAMVINFWEKEN